jgi:hypothetical protein
VASGRNFGKFWSQKTPGRFLLVALIAALLLFSVTVQVTHFHPDGVAHQDCVLCQGVQNVVGPTVAPYVQELSTQLARVAVPLDRQFRLHILSYSHWNRPPPDPAA